jgi:LuxR family transcriptional regulator, maltose regulon positive regulatory protein
LSTKVLIDSRLPEPPFRNALLIIPMTSASDLESDRFGEPPHHAFRPVTTRALAGLASTQERFKLLAVVAPVGYGKTVLMSELHARLVAHGERCYWTTLDERDTRAEDVLQRLERHSSRFGNEPHPTQALFRGGESLETRIESLIRVAGNRAGGFTAFIDNLHFCTDPQLGPLLDRLVFDSPESARFVFSSTAALPIHLARAKLEGRVRQIGYTELSLDLAGVADLLGSRITEALGKEHLEAILSQTEGWPAALRMMQLALAGSREPRALLQQFSGSDEDLVALLNRQVLRDLTHELRDFLLAIAPLQTFDAALCEQATGDARAQAHLDWLVQHNVFMVPLDRARSRYRLHGLFRQCLLGEAKHAMTAASRNAVLERAAHWCEQQGQWRDAMDYALAAHALTVASRVLEKTALTFVRNRGDIPQYIAWARTLLDLGATLGWEAQYWYVWGLVLNQRYDEGRHQLDRFASRIRRTRGSGKESGAMREIERRLDIVRMCIAVFTDELDDADQQAATWLESASADDPFDITVARCIRSIHGSSIYRFVDARAAIAAAQSSASQTRSEYAQGWIVALTHLPSILEGHYAKAHPALVDALARLPEHLGENAGICGTIALLAGACAVEMGEDDDARALIEQGLQTAHSHGFIDAVACGLDAALKLWSGELSNTGLPDRLQRIASHYPPRLAFLLGCHRIRRLLRLGYSAEAQAEAATLGLDPDRPSDLPSWAQGPRGRDIVLSTLIDLKVSAGHGRSMSPLITELLRTAKANNRVARQVDLTLMEGLIEIGENHLANAARHLTRAIALATPRRIVRPFRDLAPSLAVLIEDTKPGAWGFATAEERRFFADLCSRLPLRDASLQDRLVSLNIEARLHESLTARQVELLALLEAGLSNQQISDRLDVTLTTIKGHLQRLYGKLGVSSRSAALARAKVLKLV